MISKKYHQVVSILILVFKQRSENMMPTPFVLNDATIIKTNITF
jgi:hypothetical protein